MSKILYISHEHNELLGCTHSLYNMIHSLPKHYEPIVMLPAYGIVYDYFTERGIRCIVTKYHVDFVGWGYSYKYYLTFLFRFIRDAVDHHRAINHIAYLLCDEKIDIVHTNTAVIDFGQALAKRLGAYHVWHLREFINLDMGYQPFLGWKRLCKKIKESDAIISITHAIAEHYGVNKLPQAHIMFDAVRCEKELLYSEKKEKYFVFCGQICPHKGPDIAIQAFEQFLSFHPDYKLRLLGKYEEDYKKQLLALVSPNTETKIDFLGYSNEVENIVSKATALLMCSRNEAQGRVTIEAMLMSCPVIARNAGGTKEIVAHRQNGLLFGTINECVDAMINIVSDETLAKTLASDALKYAKKNFLEETYGQKIHDLYNSLTSIKK